MNTYEITKKEIKGLKILEKSYAVSDSNAVRCSSAINNSNAVNISTAISNSNGIIYSNAINIGAAVYNSNAVSRSYAISYSYGIYDCRALKYCIFCYKLEAKKYYIFNKKVSKKRFDKVIKDISNFKWYPKYDNFYKLKENKEWRTIAFSKLQIVSNKTAWNTMPEEMDKYIRSLPEFNEEIYKIITEK